MIFLAMGVAAVIMALAAVAAYLISPNGRSTSSLGSMFSTLQNSNSVALLEAERQNLIVMNVAAGTLTNVAKPAMVNPSAVMASAGASGGSSGAQTVAQAAPPNPGTAQHIGYEMLPQFGFNQTSQWSCLLALWNQESGWRYDAENPSGAYGIPQALPGDRMASVGSDWMTNPVTQIKWGLEYIQQRYVTPCAAENHELADHWY
jgi:hypothetical protein